MTIRWIYLDESEFQLDDKPYIAYGALITEDIVTQENINKALTTLRKFKDNQDKDYLPKNDNRTLERGYFHACDDACCAHTAICREIENLNGEISLNCIPKSETSNLNALSMTSAIMGLHHIGYSALIYEQRTGLTNEIINTLVQEYEISVIRDYASTLFMPICFSEPGYKISDKAEPGIQFIDFILWAYQRKLNGNPDWYNRIHQNSIKSKGIHITTQYAENQVNEDFFLTSTLNKGLTIPENIGVYHDTNLNKNYLSINNLDDITDKNIFDSLLLINDIMSRIRYNQNPERFFEMQIKDCIENRKNNLEAFLRIFLKMFDTFNFLNMATDIETKNKLLLARKIAALSFYYKYSDCIELQNKLQEIWNVLITLKFV